MTVREKSFSFKVFENYREKYPKYYASNYYPWCVLWKDWNIVSFSWLFLKLKNFSENKAKQNKTKQKRQSSV